MFTVGEMALISTAGALPVVVADGAGELDAGGAWIRGCLHGPNVSARRSTTDGSSLNHQDTRTRSGIHNPVTEAPYVNTSTLPRLREDASISRS